jgi:hypothetical protein
MMVSLGDKLSELLVLRERQQNLEATIKQRFADARRTGEVVVRVGSLGKTLREIKARIQELKAEG